MICVNKLEHTRKCSKEHKKNPHVGGDKSGGSSSVICVNKLEHTRKFSNKHKNKPHVGGEGSN